MSVNLRSDTQTRPTEAMRAAIAGAEVGDEQWFNDPTTIRLQERVAELLGHEAGLFLPSGTMCNLIAFRLHLRPGGDEVILAEDAHPVGFEAGSPGAINSAMTRVIPTPTGIYSADDVRAALRQQGNRYSPRSRLVSVEQTTNMGSGRVWPLETIREVLGVARQNELRAHLDGARLMNAVVASGVSASDYASGFDTAWIDFTKGLGAPIGAVMAGSAELIEEAWRYKQMLGGAMRQSGIASAGCLHALDHHVERLAADHANARSLAEGLAGIEGVDIDASVVETNIVIFGVDDAYGVVARAWEAGVWLTAVAPDRIRAVTHLDVAAEEIPVAVEGISAAIAAG